MFTSNTLAHQNVELITVNDNIVKKKCNFKINFFSEIDKKKPLKRGGLFSVISLPSRNFPLLFIHGGELLGSNM